MVFFRSNPNNIEALAVFVPNRVGTDVFHCALEATINDKNIGSHLDNGIEPSLIRAMYPGPIRTLIL